MSVNDVIKKSFLKAFDVGNTISTETVIAFVMCMTIALLVGMAICFIYERFFICREGIFSRSFALTLVGMTLLTCMVTLAISTNVIISLGMVGSLSIVRYRTAIKEPMDLLYLFWAITSGISIGAGMYILTLCGLIFMILFISVSSKVTMGKQNYVLIVNYKEEEIKHKILEKLKNVRWKLKSTVWRENNFELTIQIMGSNKRIDIEQSIAKTEGVSNVVLISFNGEYND